MKKRMLILTSLIVFLTLCVISKGTYAWFTDVVSYEKIYEIGDIKYIYSGTLLNTSSEEIVVPGQPLITSESLYLTNQSKIDSNLRIQIHFSYEDQITHEIVSEIYSGQAGNHINDFMAIELDSGWIYDEDDSCWHYQYDSSYAIPASTTETGYSFNLINAISFDGEKVDNTLSGATFHLQLIFQAKQLQFVDWQTIGTEDIENLVGS
jgi:predicted ribosomally synthesized peptide with SipW-like signal peptide